MLKEEGASGAGGGGGAWAHVCDSCRAAASVVYCRADLAYLCAGCDARIHAANRVASRHERVWVCEACESAPAAFTCKADAAALCTTCDADIHSANPLARRHHRVPILPISGCLYGPPAATGQLFGRAALVGRSFSAPEGDQEDHQVEEEDGGAEEEDEEEDHQLEEDETASWLLFNHPVNKNVNVNDHHQGNGYLFGGDVDEYLDLVEYNSCTDNQYPDRNQYNQQQQNQQMKLINDPSDSVVPVQQQQSLQLEMEYHEASKAGFSYTGGAISNSVSYSSMDASIVPDSTMNEISNSHSRTPKGTIDLFASPPLQMPPQFTPMDREARVLRYREKRKTRKFEKTIRYASRKAYAETRPRIKGRFAKRADVEVEVDQMFSASLLAETEYGIVPSF